MVDIKKLQSLLFDDDSDDEEEASYTSDQPLANENTTQIQIDPGIFAEPEDSVTEDTSAEEETPAEEEVPEEPERPSILDELFGDDDEEEDTDETAEEVTEETPAEDVPEEVPADVPAEEEPVEEPVIAEEPAEEEPAEEPLSTEDQILADAFFPEELPEEPLPEKTLEEKIDDIVYGDDVFADIDDLFAELTAATDLSQVAEPVFEEPKEEPVVFPSDPVTEDDTSAAVDAVEEEITVVEEEPEEEDEPAEELLEDVPVSDIEEPAEEEETTNIVEFFSDISGEDIPDNVANEKTSPLDLDAILGTEHIGDDEETAALEVIAEPEPEPIPIPEEKPVRKDPGKKEFVYHFQPILSPLFGADLSESQTTKKGDDIQIIVSSSVEVSDDAPTEILDTRHLKNEDED